MFLEKFIQINSRLMSALLPPMCVLCGYPAHHSSNICIPCQQELPILSHACRRCAQFLHATESLDLICGACLKGPTPFDFTHALFPYQPPIMQLIIQLKFQHQLSHAKAFGELLTQKIQQEWYRNRPLPDLIIPVPLHPMRLKERGFNQALEIARPIAKTLVIPIDIHGVKRIKHTAAHSGLSSAADRKLNIENAFAATYCNFSDLSIAVIDDVITTGHTIREFCRVLKQHGAKRIDVWCCARRG